MLFAAPDQQYSDTRLARKFAGTVDCVVEYAQANNISDDDFRVMVNNALCDLLGIGEPDLLQITSECV